MMLLCVKGDYKPREIVCSYYKTNVYYHDNEYKK